MTTSSYTILGVPMSLHLYWKLQRIMYKVVPVSEKSELTLNKKKNKFIIITKTSSKYWPLHKK